MYENISQQNIHWQPAVGGDEYLCPGSDYLDPGLDFDKLGDIHQIDFVHDDQVAAGNLRPRQLGFLIRQRQCLPSIHNGDHAIEQHRTPDFRNH